MVGRDWRTCLILVVIGAAVAAALRPGLRSAFSSENQADFTRAPHAPDRPGHWPFHNRGPETLTRWSWQLDRVVWGALPRGPLWTNLALHIVNGWLVYALALALFRCGRAQNVRPSAARHGAALLAALLFALHPLRVEPVVWVAQRATLLSGMSALAATLCYLRGAAGARPAWLGLAFACTALSVAAGNAGLTLPLVFIVLDWYPLRRLGPPGGWLRQPAQRVWLEKLPFVLVAAGALVLALISPDASDAAPHLDGLERVALASWSAVFYAWQTVWPHGLAPLYELAPPITWLSWQFGAATVVVLVVLGAALAQARRAPAVTCAVLAYALLLLPDAVLLPNGFVVAADRGSYLPGAVIALALAAGLAGLWAQRDLVSRIAATGATLAGCVAVGALGMLTWQQTRLWHDARTLWQYTLDQYPTSGLAAGELACARERAGETTPAVQLYSSAVRFSPRVLEIRLRLGAALLQEADAKAASAAYQGAVKLAPQSAEAQFGLGVALAAGNDLAAAEERLRRAQTLAPHDVRPPSALGHLYMLQGRWSQAAEAFRAALRLTPDDADLHYDLGHALQRNGDHAAAAAMFRRCLELSPDHRLASAALAGLTGQPTAPPPAPAATQTSRPSAGP